MSQASTSIVAIAGSPSASSKSAALLGLAAAHLGERGLTIETINVRSLDAAALIAGKVDHPQIAAALALVAAAHG